MTPRAKSAEKEGWDLDRGPCQWAPQTLRVDGDGQLLPAPALTPAAGVITSVPIIGAPTAYPVPCTQELFPPSYESGLTVPFYRLGK